MSQRHRYEYAVVIPRGLPDSFGIPAKEFPAPQGRVRTASGPERGQVRAGVSLRDVTTPVPRVLLSVTLTGPAPSGSTGTPRLC